VPYSARQAFRDGCDPSTILRLVRVARAAKALQAGDRTPPGIIPESDELNAALAELDAK
jgi:hypothetical protein